MNDTSITTTQLQQGMNCAKKKTGKKKYCFSSVLHFAKSIYYHHPKGHSFSTYAKFSKKTIIDYSDTHKNKCVSGGKKC